MSAALKPVGEDWAERTQDALIAEVAPMLDAIQVLALYAGALREVEAVADREPAFGRKLALGGVDLPTLMDHAPDERIAELAYAARVRVTQLIEQRRAQYG